MGLVIAIIVLYLIFGTATGRKIAASIFGKIAKTSAKIIIYIILAGLCVFLLYHLICWVLSNLLLSLFIVIAAISILFIIGTIIDNKDRKRHAELVNQWKNQPTRTIELSDLIKMLEPYIQQIKQADTNNTKFSSDFPFGRVTYFINFFQQDLSNDEPLYFSPLRSKDANELREYGTVVTATGIYISHQTDSTDSDGKYRVKDKAFRFNSIVATELLGDILTVYYEKYDDKVEIRQEETTIPIAVINEVCQMISACGISKAICDERVYDYADVVNAKEEEFNLNNTMQGFAKAYSTAGVAASVPEMNKVFAEVGNTMNKRQGHGDAAEYANTAFDRFTGDFRAKHMGADNAKNGADRSTHRLFHEETLIQCKYGDNPTAIIRDAFVNHDYAKGVIVEVPRDKYFDCLKDLQRRIDSGELEHKGIKKGERAEDYLKRGYFTNNQTHNIATAGRIEGITVDAMQGIVCSVGAGSITALVTFATCKWNGMETKEAAMQSLKTGASAIGKSTAIFIITMQLTRKDMVANLWEAIRKTEFKDPHNKDKVIVNAAKTVSNPIFAVSESLAKKINTSALAKSKFGKGIKLDKLTGKHLISGTITAVVTFGPDILRALTGRISAKQLIKNSAVGGAGIAGATIGSAITPIIPVVGGMIGGAVAGFIAKKALDRFIEDDAVEMFAILKEEFIDIVPLSGLNEDEFNKVVEMTIAHKKLPSLLRDMYAYGDSREYAREHIVNTAVQHVLGQRELITDDMYCEGMSMLITEAA